MKDYTFTFAYTENTRKTLAELMKRSYEPEHYRVFTVKTSLASGAR